MNPLPLATAQRYAAEIIKWLGPYCVTLQIAGSIRRNRPYVNDVDIVCIPKVTCSQDLLGADLDRSNLALEFLQDYVKERNPTASPAREPRFISGGEKEGKQVMLQLPKCQLDLWFAAADNFATRLLMRTGSKEHNIWFADRAAFHGLHWHPYEGLTPLPGKVYIWQPTEFATPVTIPAGQFLPCKTEQLLYFALGLSYLEPKNRELPWLAKHIDSGL